MRIRRGVTILVISLLFAVALFGLLLFRDRQFGLLVTIDTGIREEVIKPWWNEEEGCYCFFLPSYANAGNTLFYCSDADYFIDGQGIGSYVDSMNPFEEEDCLMKVSRHGLFSAEDYQIRVMKSGNVNTLFISSKSGKMEKVYNKKDKSEEIEIIASDENGRSVNINKMCKISGHGNSTWKKPKKPFSIKADVPFSMFDMEVCSEWILLANYLDTGSLRNKIALDFAKNLGFEMVSESTFTDVYIDNEYQGLYLLVQSPKALFKVKHYDDSSLLFAATIDERIKYPNYSFKSERNCDITLVKTQNLYGIDGTFSIARDQIEKADEVIVSGSDYEELSKVIDIDSWVRKYLFNEIMMNYDSGVESEYFYCYTDDAHDSRLYAGPCWDFDNILGNQEGFCGTTDDPRILYVANGLKTDYGLMLWFKELYDQPQFRDRAIEQYKVCREYLIDFLNENQIGILEARYNRALKCNALRWNAEYSETYEDYLRNYLTERVEFLDDIWLNNSEYHLVLIRDTYDVESFIYYLKDGERLSENERFLSRREFKNLRYSSDDHKFDPASDITEDIELYYRSHDERSAEEVRNDKIKYNIDVLIAGAFTIVLGMIALVLLNKDCFANRRVC